MKTDQKQKLVYILFAPLLVVILASSLIAAEYPEYTDHVVVGLGVFVIVLAALAIFMIRNKAT
jgi:hypothetical protein